MTKKKTEVEKGVKRLKDLEIDEVSMVDKPAIGETFVVTKSVKTDTNKGANVVKVKKTVSWKGHIQKDANSTHCVFCGITKAEEAETMGMGLISNVCFECACEHHEKGVFDDVLAGTFEPSKFSEKYPDIKLKMTLEKTDGENSEEANDESDEQSTETESGDANGESGKEGDASEAESNDDANKDSSSDNSNEGGETASSSGSESDDSSESELANGGEIGKRVTGVEKSLVDVKAMLEGMMMLHDSAAYALNEIVGLTLACLDMTSIMVEEDAQSDENKAVLVDIKEKMKAVREDISKRGAKISQSRLTLLQEIATKLSSLIDSVRGESEKGGKKTKALTEYQKSLEAFKEEVLMQNSSFKKDIEQKLKATEEKLSDIEQSGGGSMGIDDDEDDSSDEDEPAQKSKSLFSGIIDVDGIKKSAEERKRRTGKN